MDYFFLAFAIAALGVLVTLCLFVIEYQNSRTRRLNQIWSDRLGALTDSGRPIPAPPAPPTEQHAA